MYGELPPIDKSIVVYGLGSFSKRIIEQLVSLNRSIAYIIDRDSFSNNFLGIPVVRPTEPLPNPSDHLCVILLHNHYLDLKPIHSLLTSLGFNDVILVPGLKKIEPRLRIPGGTTGGYWYDSSFDISEHSEIIDQMMVSLADDKSRSFVDSTVKYRKYGNLIDLPFPSLDDEYCPKDLERYAPKITVLDCGAYTGDSIQQFIAHGYELTEVIAFEPDLLNFSRLTRTEFCSGRATLLPLATGNQNIGLPFDSQGSAASGLKTGSSIATCVRIDDVMLRTKVDVIKFDVEGAEYESLLGAKKTITTWRPSLCISIYHEPEHLFSIWALLSSWNLDYRFYVRVHEFNGFGTVLYCRPLRQRYSEELSTLE
jgi:FkbM family methyltransferase